MSQSNFRLSAQVRAELARVARETGLSKTEVVEFAVLNYAARLPGLAEHAADAIRALFLEKLKQNHRKK